jgi:hypothetical protein
MPQVASKNREPGINGCQRDPDKVQNEEKRSLNSHCRAHKATHSTMDTGGLSTIG